MPFAWQAATMAVFNSGMSTELICSANSLATISSQVPSAFCTSSLCISGGNANDGSGSVQTLPIAGGATLAEMPWALRASGPVLWEHKRYSMYANSAACRYTVSIKDGGCGIVTYFLCWSRRRPHQPWLLVPAWCAVAGVTPRPKSVIAFVPAGTAVSLVTRRPTGLLDGRLNDRVDEIVYRIGKHVRLDVLARTVLLYEDQPVHIARHCELGERFRTQGVGHGQCAACGHCTERTRAHGRRR